MKAVETNPPPLPRPAVTQSGRQALVSLALLLGLIAFASVALHYQLPLPACPLRETTGVPCPLCGSTRAFASLAGLDFLEALRLNPLVCLVACGLGALWLLALARVAGPMAWLQRRSGVGRSWQWLLALALLLNSLYLCLYLPR